MEGPSWPLPPASLAIVRVEGFVACRLSIAEHLALIHRQAARASTETDSFRTKFSSVTLPAVNFSFVLSGTGRVESLQAEAAIEADFMPFLAASENLLGVVNHFGALRAPGLLHCGMERHFFLSLRSFWDVVEEKSESK